MRCIEWVLISPQGLKCFSLSFILCWKIVEFFGTFVMHRALNETIIRLISKVDIPEMVLQFCPISLCNVP
ncbi:hypothetical protein V2J09_021924 [Rumex salicifolius]